MYGVVNGIQIEFFGAFGNLEFAFASTGFRHHAFLQIGLGVPDHFAEQFGKLGAVFSLFHGILTESGSNLGIALTVSLT